MKNLELKLDILAVSLGVIAFTGGILSLILEVHTFGIIILSIGLLSLILILSSKRIAQHFRENIKQT